MKRLSIDLDRISVHARLLYKLETMFFRECGKRTKNTDPVLEMEYPKDYLHRIKGNIWNNIGCYGSALHL